MPTPPPPMEPHDALGYLVKHAHLRLTALTDAALAPLGIDSKDFGVLRVLVGRAPMSQQEAAAKLGVDRTTMVALIDAFEARGAVTRRPDPNDRRRNAIELTERGLALYRKADAAYVAAEGRFLAPLDPAVATQLRQALRTVLAPPEGRDRDER
ncbi:MarR family winged helix-turn-helix transcriptional regulator [Actinacidiphila acidipaludis]|uniref:MarR family transcriptional regulator n=1 Tax=Actinacidiphila acidipaludis TaxID=2873382 RepID=A0ABS7Q260_9ACTN|nr:MarR family transcriptional regulator [Streptomyces acidipaludis]MBY8877227.1 MarR family transcriptional regulator [Streptomyces acidipaludis]